MSRRRRRSIGSIVASTSAHPDHLASRLAFAESVCWILTGLVAIFAAFVVYGLTRTGQPGAVAVLAMDATVLVVAASMRVWVGRQVLTLRTLDIVSASVVVLVLLNTGVSAIVQSDASDIGYLPLILVAAGAVLISPYWFWVMVGLTVSGVVPLALWFAEESNTVLVIASLASSVVLGATIHVGRARSYRQLEAWRARDEERTRELRCALEQVEHELAERLRAEVRRRELEEQLRRSQRIEALGVLAGGMAHDMNNVLGAITSVASTARDGLGPSDPSRADFEQILQAAHQGSALTRNLLGFARRGKMQNRRLNLSGLVREVIELLKRTLPKRVVLVDELASGLDDVVGDGGQLSHVLMNLCLNAADAIHESGTIRVRARNHEVVATSKTLRPGRYLELTVEDDGVGMSQRTLARAFEPFFTTKASNERSGLGLSMVHGTVHEHGGEIAVESKPGEGTKVTVLLPSVPASSEPTIAPPAPSLADQIRVVLLVDDEPLIRSSGTRLLKSVGIQAHVAKDGHEALEVFQKNSEAIEAVVLDLSMPGMGGVECFEQLRIMAPRIPVLVASGYTMGEDLDRLLTHEHVGFIAKPYEKRAFVRALREVMVNAAYAA